MAADDQPLLTGCMHIFAGQLRGERRSTTSWNRGFSGARTHGSARRCRHAASQPREHKKVERTVQLRRGVTGLEVAIIPEGRHADRDMDWSTGGSVLPSTGRSCRIDATTRLASAWPGREGWPSYSSSFAC